MSAPPPGEALPNAVERVLRGDLRALPAARETAPSGWTPALEALAGLHGAPAPAPRVAARPDGPGGVWAALYGALFGFLREDRAEVARAARETDGPRSRCLADGYLALLEGAAIDEPRDLEPRPAPLALACAVHARCLASLASADAPVRAVVLAREASTLAERLGFLVEAHLAHATLARARRVHGRGYAASRIAVSLRGASAAPWHPWIDWELAVAGAPGGLERGSAVDRLVGCALAGDRAGFEEERRRTAPGWSQRAIELDAAARMLDARLEARGAARAWCEGLEGAPPRGIRLGPGTASGHDGMILSRPGRPARRVAASGARLLAEEGPWEADPGQTHARSRAALARLAVRGPTPRAELWREVYGFGYVPVKHSGALRVLIHRARALLGEAAQIDEGPDGLTLRPRVALLVADPATERSVADRLLALVAGAEGRATARELAKTLRVSLRTVQSVLGDLVEEGTCVSERDGRAIHYAVEDTTFQTAIRPATS